MWTYFRMEKKDDNQSEARLESNLKYNWIESGTHNEKEHDYDRSHPIEENTGTNGLR